MFVILALLLAACGQAPRTPSEPAGNERSAAGALRGSGGPQIVRPATATPTANAPARPKDRGLPPPAIDARAALVLDVASGAQLFAANADLRLPPASLTKIATAVVVLESGIDLDQVIEVNPDLERLWLDDVATMGLLPGDRFSVRELLEGLLLVSGADAAIELAKAVAGGPAPFVERMNALAARLGLRDTRFTDVHGLGGPGHYSSARDLAALSVYAMTFPAFRQVVATESHVTTGSRELSLYNQNPLLNYTTGVDGIKVGYTEEAGPTFVVSVTRGGVSLMLVLLDAPRMALDAIALVEWAYANFDWSR